MAGDVTQQAAVLKKMEKQKGRINDLLSGMFTNMQ